MNESEEPAPIPSEMPPSSYPESLEPPRKQRRLWGFVCGAGLGAALLELGLLHTLIILGCGVAGMYLAGDADELRARIRRWL